jgi:hypothetical protein
MRLAVHYDYPVPPERVARLLQDRTFSLEAAQAAGAESCHVQVDLDPSGAFTLTARLAGATAELPPQVRTLLPQGLEIRQAQVWEAAGPEGRRSGTLAGEIVGAPVRITGRVALSPSATGSRLAVACQVSAPIPLLGPTIEKAALPAVASYLAAQHSVAERRLAAGG